MQNLLYCPSAFLFDRHFQEDISEWLRPPLAEVAIDLQEFLRTTDSDAEVPLSHTRRRSRLLTKITKNEPAMTNPTLAEHFNNESTKQPHDQDSHQRTTDCFRSSTWPQLRLSIHHWVLLCLEQSQISLNQLLSSKSLSYGLIFRGKCSGNKPWPKGNLRRSHTAVTLEFLSTAPSTVFKQVH